MSIGNLLILSLVLIAAWFIAAAAARSAVRREMEKLRGELKGWRAETPLTEPAPVALPAGPVATPASEPAPAAVPVPAATTAAASEPPPAEQLDDEILAVLTAAVAAFLGKTVRIRRARLMGPAQLSNAWAQQGRVYVQASHNLGAR